MGHPQLVRLAGRVERIAQENEARDLLTLGGQRKVVTVFFSDMAGFTSVSEKMSAASVGFTVGLRV